MLLRKKKPSTVKLKKKKVELEFTLIHAAVSYY